MRALMLMAALLPPMAGTAYGETVRGWFPDIYTDRAIAWDCRDCDEDRLAWLVCYIPERHMEFYLPGAAFKEDGRKTGDAVTVAIRADDFQKVYEGTTEFWGQIGHVPLLTPPYGDRALYEALSSADAFTVSVNGKQARIHLKGSHAALDAIFRAC